MALSVYPPAYETPIGVLRNLINDVEQNTDPHLPNEPAEYLFSDARLGAFLALNSGNVRFAAADCIDALADNESLVLKKIRTEDLQTDGPAVTNALRLHATSLRAQAKQELLAEEDGGGMEIVDFQYVPSNPYPHGLVGGLNPWL